MSTTKLASTTVATTENSLSETRFLCILYLMNYSSVNRLSGTSQWRVARPPSRDDWAIIRPLEPGRKYEIQVVTRSDRGESSGVIQVIVAGAGPGQPLLYSLQIYTSTVATERQSARMSKITNDDLTRMLIAVPIWQ